MAVESIQSVRAEIAIIDDQVRDAVQEARVVTQENDKLAEERALQDRIRERKEEDDQVAAQLAADLLAFDRNIGRSLHDRVAERGAILDIVA